MSLGDANLRTFWNLIIGLLLALAAVPAWALGLGQIQVRSQPGQPLLAEIPIISSDPEELRGLQARLASPEVFRRIGLQTPSGTVSNLQFALAVGSNGQPLIRITTPQPVHEPALTFLVEVDWGQGRMVREYTALVDAPRTVEATAQPQVAMPQVAEPSIVQRELPATASAPVVAQPQPVQTPPAPSPSFAQLPPTPAQMSAQPQPLRSGVDVEVQRGQSLSEIASANRGDVPLNQMMAVMLQNNPEAFIGGNINRLREGAVLRLPTPEQLQAVDAARANAIVRGQVAQRHQQGRSAAISAAPAQARAQARAASASAAAAAPREARLEIAPPGASDTTQAGTQSGMVAGGEGDMLRQELQETLAARESEVAELKARVAELEQLSTDQQRLIQLKDEELAQVQTGVDANQQSAMAGIWWWALPIALLLAAIAWLFTRGKANAPSRGYLADRAEPAPAQSNVDAEPAAPEGFAEPVSTAALAQTPAQPSPEVSQASSDASVTAPPQSTPVVQADTAAQAPLQAQPQVASADKLNPELDFSQASAANDMERSNAAAWQGAASSPTSPAWHGLGAPVIGAAASEAPNPSPTVRDTVSSPVIPTTASRSADSSVSRLELARAYLDLGDEVTARTLLREVQASGDAAAYDEAQRLLDSLNGA